MNSFPSFFGIFIDTFTTKQFSMFLTFVTGVILARSLGPGGRGVVAMVITSVTIFGNLAALCNGANDILLGEDNSRQNFLFTQTIVWNIFIVFLLLGGFLASSQAVWQFFFSADTFEMLGVFLALLWLSMSNEGLRRLLLARQDFFFLNRLEVVALTVYAVSLASSLYGLRGNILAVILCLIVKDAFLFASYVWRLFTHMGYMGKTFALQIDASLLRQSFILGSRVVLTGIPSILLLQVDIWILKWFTAFEVVGIYKVAVSMCMFALNLSRMLNGIIKAKAVSEIGGAERALFTSKLFLSFGVLSYIPILIFGRWVVRWMYGIEFTESFDLIRILWLAVLIWGFALPMAGYVVAKQKYPLRIVVGMNSALVVNIFLNFVFIPKWGVRGAAFASVISYAGMAFTYLYSFKLETHIPMQTFFTYSSSERAILKQQISSLYSSLVFIK